MKNGKLSRADVLAQQLKNMSAGEERSFPIEDRRARHLLRCAMDRACRQAGWKRVGGRRYRSWTERIGEQMFVVVARPRGY